MGPGPSPCTDPGGRGFSGPPPFLSTSTAHLAASRYSRLTGSGSDAAWVAFQEDLASLSTNSVHRVIDGATHGDMVADEGAAAATSQAILDVVSSVRRGEPLVR